MRRRGFVQSAAYMFVAGAVNGCATLVSVPVEARNGRVRLVIRHHPQLETRGGYLRIKPAELSHHLIVLALAENEFVALSPICTHQQCVVEVNGARIVCPCHGSEYDRTGRVLTGPAPRALRRYATELTSAGELVIDLTTSV